MLQFPSYHEMAWNVKVTRLNRYINLKRIEFIITDACSGRCKHCANGERSGVGGSINPEAAVTTVNRLAQMFEIKSVMTFGGEPLLYADTVCEIHAAARECGIPRRQIITNGFFSGNEQKIDQVAKALCEAGVNDILLSVDVFHQEYIPFEPVMLFAKSLLKYRAPSLRVHPAWLVNEQDGNAYNLETRRILSQFTEIGVQSSKGNNVFSSGNAIKHLAEYFALPGKVDLSVPCGSSPHTTRLDAIDCFGINPNGDIRLCSIAIGNIYQDDVLDTVSNYNPNNMPPARAVLNGGVPELLRYAETQGVTVDISDCRSACGVCRKAMEAISTKMKEM